MKMRVVSLLIKLYFNILSILYGIITLILPDSLFIIDAPYYRVMTGKIKISWRFTLLAELCGYNPLWLVWWIWIFNITRCQKDARLSIDGKYYLLHLCKIMPMPKNIKK